MTQKIADTLFVIKNIIPAKLKSRNDGFCSLNFLQKSIDKKIILWYIIYTTNNNFLYVKSFYNSSSIELYISSSKGVF